ncbi:DUF221-domain-containing protein [Microthyrium microscopicum]|uniref:DUF221-domain-containing protein n=1 Tax=Microthyrium microscopicum TaxID=703497 RepID=A0A6A6UGG4_9PEZI|nr:DUF221-domain-containing protein [Microthyrium microscopicum]
MAHGFWALSDDDNYRKRIIGDPKDTVFQILLSLLIGTSAFLGFCVLRPRWPSLYAARKRTRDEAEVLPDLPPSLFGWIPALWRVSEEQVLASAGLDAFVFLAFFKMAIKYLAVALFFSLVVIKPVHDSYPEHDKKQPHNSTLLVSQVPGSTRDQMMHLMKKQLVVPGVDQVDYLWMYLVFVYFFTGVALYLIIGESKKIIEIRQAYLGDQSTVTDRTIRLYGIPEDLRSESKIKEFIEYLEIGKVESVTLIRDWKMLDKSVEDRGTVLEKLERAMVEYAHRLKEQRHMESPVPSTIASPLSDDESARLLEEATASGHEFGDKSRPQKRIWHGRLNLQHKKVDAIDYYEEKLRQLDEEISTMRKKEFPAKPLAFVTMDSIASCQMAVQAVLDSAPLQLIATSSPSPVDIDWKNTYMPRKQALFRSWSVTGLIGLLTVFWSATLLPIAGLIDLDRIHSIWPQLADFLSAYPLAASLIQTQLPTIVISLLTIAVPYLYSWLAYQQAMISHGDVELSVISKNFFFTFFNLFIVFTVLGTASLTNLEDFGSQPLRDTANNLATSLQDLRNFYVNYIILQALGLFPLRLLEFGSVSLYPFGLLAAKTPREHEKLKEPPTFSYGFFLPQTLLIFLICIVYSVLRGSWQILLPGLAYFLIGYFVYKYQLLYAMDHQQHSTGKSWVIIVDRIIVGLIVFQITVAGQLALRGALRRSAAVAPLAILTLWFGYVYSQSYKPLMTYIALKSIRRAEHRDEEESEVSQINLASRNRRSVDEVREKGMHFVNPSLTTPLEPPWISGKRPRNGSSRDTSSDRSGEV